MQGNQFPSSNENINIQLRLSPLILLSEGLEKEANELSRQERCFFFEEWCLKGLFFFPRCRQKTWKKILFEFFRGENRRANPEALLLPVPTRGQRAGSIPEKAGPHREDRQLFWLSLPLRAPPVHAPSLGRQLVARAPRPPSPAARPAASPERCPSRRRAVPPPRSPR